VASNLTRDEARERARLLDVESYRVELDLTSGEESFGSVTTVSFGCASPGTSTFIDLSAPAVHEITLNGVRVSPESFDGNRIWLDGLAERNELRVAAECAYSRSGEGLHRFTDPADGAVYMYTDFETFDAHRAYACFDQPDLKAMFQFEVTARPRDSGDKRGGVREKGDRRGGVREKGDRRGGVREKRDSPLVVPAHAAAPDLHHRGGGRPVLRGARRARRHPARHLLPPVAGRLPGPG
jgi:aminopeptidase N